jgi:tRNA modification GTPase
MYEEQEDTIISLISSASGGSIAMLRISGPSAFDTVKEHFRGTTEREIQGGRFFFGRIIGNGEILDEVVILFYKKPHSYTGEDVAEISCHANPFIIKDIITVFQEAGCRLAEPGEFTKRAFLNGKMDLIQAEAVADLIMSKSRAGVKNSLMQIEGRLSQHLNRIKKDIIDTASLLELDLDFSEEDLEIIEPEVLVSKFNEIIEAIDILVQSYQYGHVLSKGVEVLIAGKPNVGKSSLMNAFLMKDRVIVSERPGTTRDMIHEDIVIDNILIRFIDSAGIRLSRDLIEMEGVSRARKYMDHADILLLMIDISQPLAQEDLELLERICGLYPQKMLVCGNKSDLGIHEENKRLLNESNLEAQIISIVRNEGIERLKKQIVKKVHDMEQHLGDDVMISNERQFSVLKKCRDALHTANTGLKDGLGYEFVAVDLRTAVTHIAEITGEITADDILSNIFSQFCIGK